MTKIVALTEKGLVLANQILSLLSNSEQESSRHEIIYKPKPFAPAVQQVFTKGEPLIFIGATGIVVRTLAPVLKNKKTDPPVLVLDESGRFVIPLLSGHEGGANELASKLAESLNAQPVFTTANSYLDPVYTIGMGCERNCPISELTEIMNAALELAGVSITQISSINSIDIKADEAGLLNLATSVELPYQTWNKIELTEVEGLLSTRSEYIYQVVGVYGVAESAALIAAQRQTGQLPELVLSKIKTPKATCAIARAYPQNNQ